MQHFQGLVDIIKHYLNSLRLEERKNRKKGKVNINMDKNISLDASFGLKSIYKVVCAGIVR